MRKVWIIIVLILCTFIIFIWSPLEVEKNGQTTPENQISVPSETN